MYDLSLKEIEFVSGGICPYCILAGVYYFAGASSTLLGVATNQYALFALSGVLLTIGSYYAYEYWIHL